jgi:hypothetical protein
MGLSDNIVGGRTKEATEETTLPALRFEDKATPTDTGLHASTFSSSPPAENFRPSAQRLKVSGKAECCEQSEAMLATTESSPLRQVEDRCSISTQILEELPQQRIRYQRYRP